MLLDYLEPPKYCIVNLRAQNFPMGTQALDVK